MTAKYAFKNLCMNTIITAPKLIGNGAYLFMNETRKQIDQSISLEFIDVKMIGQNVRLHARFMKEE